MVGDNDNFTPVKHSEKIKDKLTLSELRIIKNSGHLSPIENPEEFNKYLENFLTGKK